MNSLFRKIKIMYWRWRWHHTKWIYVRKWEDCDPEKIEKEPKLGQMMTFPEYQEYCLSKIAASMEMPINAEQEDLMDIVNEFLRHGLPMGGKRSLLPIREHVLCADGFVMSVQALRHFDGDYVHYAKMKDGKWESVEVYNPRFLSGDYYIPLQLYPYSDIDDPFASAVFSYVPVSVVAEIIREHGGMLNNLEITYGAYYRCIY